MRSVLVVVSVLVASSLGWATKPCPESPCVAVAGAGTDEAKCQGLADWIVVGRIVKVVDHPNGPPVFKNFAEFTIIIDAWEKGRPATPPAELRFQVGWCQNARPVPEGDARKGRFRFFGTGKLDAKELQYLDFVSVK